MWMQDTVPPRSLNAERPGRWIGEESWPSPRIEAVRFPLGNGTLEAAGRKPRSLDLTICSPQTVGTAAGKWCPYGLDPDQPGDQRTEAGGSLVFDSAPLRRPLEFAGAPILHLDVAADRPAAQVAVTLSEVLPDGAATRLSYGILNLTHRHGHESPQAVVPGERMQVAIKLNDCAQRLSPGSRLRVAISSAYWPIVWPSPQTVTLSIGTGDSSLELPVRPRRPEDRALPRFLPAENAPALEVTQLRPASSDVRITEDLKAGTVTIERYNDDGLTHIVPWDWEYGAAARRTYTVKADDPNSAVATMEWVKEFGRGDFRVSLKACTRMQALPEHFHLTATLDTWEGETRVFSREWDTMIPRDHV